LRHARTIEPQPDAKPIPHASHRKWKNAAGEGLGVETIPTMDATPAVIVQKDAGAVAPPIQRPRRPKAHVRRGAEVPTPTLNPPHVVIGEVHHETATAIRTTLARISLFGKFRLEDS
jgi:hypothetical protein